MKKVFTVIAVLALISTASFAQFKVGGGLTLGSKMGISDDGDEKMGFGVNVRGDYYFSEKFSVSPGFTYFFPGSPDGIDLSAWQVNADAHYHFVKNEGFSFYGIGGLNYSHSKYEFDSSDIFDGLGDEYGELVDGVLDMAGVSAEDTDNEIGFDLGVGVNFSKFFGEVKYDTAFDGQLAITVGILF